MIFQRLSSDDYNETTRSGNGAVNRDNNGQGIGRRVRQLLSRHSIAVDSNLNENVNFHSDDDDEDGDVDLPPGYLEFLSRQENSLDRRISDFVSQLSGQELDESDYDILTPALQDIRFVREFLYDDGAIRIANAIKEGCSSCPSGDKKVQKIPLSPQSYDSYADQCIRKKGATTTSTAVSLPPKLSSLSTCPTRHLSEINLTLCHIGDAGASAIAHAISSSCLPSLKSIDLSSNIITGHGVSCLANCLVVVFSEIDVRSNGCRSDFGCGIVETDRLPSCPKIESLSLSSNPIQSLGAQSLANALSGCKSTCFKTFKATTANSESRKIDGNCIGNLRGYCFLKKLNLSGCQLDDSDVMILGQALLPHRYNSEFQTDLTGRLVDINESDTYDFDSIPSLPPTNRLSSLHLYSNKITLKGMEYLYSIINSKQLNHERGEMEDGSGSGCNYLQSIYANANHVIDLGVSVDYGFSDFDGPFFDQLEDENLLASMKTFEKSMSIAGMGGGAVIDEGGRGFRFDEQYEIQKMLITQKRMLREKMMRVLKVNKECALALNGILEEASALQCASPFLSDTCRIKCASTDAFEKTRSILHTAALKKISYILSDAVDLPSSSSTLLQKQVAFGNQFSTNEFLSSTCTFGEVNNSNAISTPVTPPLQLMKSEYYINALNISNNSPNQPIIRCYLKNVVVGVFPFVMAWSYQHCGEKGCAVVFAILLELPDLCAFHSPFMDKIPSRVNLTSR